MVRAITKIETSILPFPKKMGEFKLGVNSFINFFPFTHKKYILYQFPFRFYLFAN